MTRPAPEPEAAAADDCPRTIRNFIGSGTAGTFSARIPTPADPTPPPRAGLLPQVGDDFLGFHLAGELGRGAFGRVFLATQPELAGRMVALKITLDDGSGESRSLARLQHTNIVPVYSVHHDVGRHAVCMPFFGRTTLADLLRLRRARTSPPTIGADLLDPVRHPPAASATFKRLASDSFERAVCWVIGRVADGLAHAHDRGIVHRDVKPANVLVADDGQPMLLDFGVAADLKAKAEAGGAGGTLAYMAPERLAELHGGGGPPDPRGDLYSLGLILFELLTGSHPFLEPVKDLDGELPRLLAERRRWVPRLPDLPHDLESIVRTCVAADPTKRYQTAADLSEDLRRHLGYERLKVATEPGGWHRFAKWRRRNPRSGWQVLAAGGVVVGLTLSIGAVLAWRSLDAARDLQQKREDAHTHERARLDAARQATEVEAELRVGRYLLAARVGELKPAPADLGRVEAALARYAVPTDPHWQARPEVLALPESARAKLVAAVADGCLLVARAHLLHEDGGAEATAAAERFNAAAESARIGPPPRAVLAQRANVYARQNRQAEAEAMATRAAATPLLSADDHFLQADELLGWGQHAEAVPLFRAALHLDPTHFWAHFELGTCHHLLGRPADAIGCYTAALAVQPDFPWAYYNRAMASAALYDSVAVAADLTAVLRLIPGFAPARLHRAHALNRLGDRPGAVRDLSAVLDTPDPGGMHVRAMLQRARLKWADNDTVGADADTAAALLFTPEDELGWLMRGLARAETDPAAALADMERAAHLNPRWAEPLQNQANVLEKLGRYDDAVRVMDRLLALGTTNPLLIVSRGVLLARLGKFDAAFKDVDAAHPRDTRRPVRARAAAVYAQASGEKPAYKRKALDLLASLVKDGHPMANLAAEDDFVRLKDDPEFQAIVGGK